MNEKIKVFEAFAGIGTQRMALRNLGIEHEVVGISEIDKYAIRSYEAIHGETMNFGDISKINPNELPDFDLFTYSFPCQDLSVAGKQQGMVKGQTRSGLLYECEKIIETKRPKYLLLENVKQLVGKKFYPQFQVWLDYLESLGYTNYWEVLNAKDFNVPQNRERVFVVSILGEHTPYKFPKLTTLNRFVTDFLESQIEFRHQFPIDKVEKIILPFLQKERLTNLIPYETNEGYKIDVLLGSTQKNAYIGNGTIIPTLTSAMGTGGGHVPMIGSIGFSCDSIHEDYFLPSISQLRRLSPKECWRLMGFLDEDYEKASQVVSQSQLYKQAGNAIVVPVLEMIFKNLFIEG